MIPPKKIISIALILVLAASGLNFFQSTIAASKPSVPEFTIRFVNATSSTPTIDPYTGESHTILTGNYSIEVKINNQATGGSNSKIFYNFRIKPHYDQSWVELYGLMNFTSKANDGGTFTYAWYISHYTPAQSTSSYTTINLEAQITDVYGQTGTYFHIPSYSGYSGSIPEGGEVDFQVQALVGHTAQVFVSDHPIGMPWLGHYEDAVAFDVASDWSNTQTITLGDRSTTSETPTSSSSSQQTTDTGNNWQVNNLVIVVLAISAVIITIIIATAAVMITKIKKGSA